MVFDSIKEKFKKKEPEATVNEESLSYEELMQSEQTYDKYTVPSNGNQLWTIVRLEFKHFLKTKSFFILFILAAIVPLIQMTGLLNIVEKFIFLLSVVNQPRDEISANMYMHYCLVLLPLIMLFCMVFFCGKTISNEYANRTAYLNMPQPMERWVIFTGKFIAISLISFSIILFAYGMAFLATALKYSDVFVMPIFESVIVSFFCMLALVAVGMLFSSIMKNRGGAMAFLTMFVLIPMIIPIIVLILSNVFHFNYNADFLQYTLPFLMDDAFILISYDPVMNIPSFLTILVPMPMPDTWALILCALIWAAGCFAGGLYLFNKKEV